MAITYPTGALLPTTQALKPSVKPFATLTYTGKDNLTLDRSAVLAATVNPGVRCDTKGECCSGGGETCQEWCVYIYVRVMISLFTLARRGVTEAVYHVCYGIYVIIVRSGVCDCVCIMVYTLRWPGGVCVCDNAIYLWYVH